MADLEMLFRAVDELTPDELNQLYDYVQQRRRALIDALPKNKRIPDLHAGAWEVSDDFDDPLPDEFWLGEES